MEITYFIDSPKNSDDILFSYTHSIEITPNQSVGDLLNLIRNKHENVKVQALYLKGQELAESDPFSKYTEYLGNNIIFVLDESQCPEYRLFFNQKKIVNLENYEILGVSNVHFDYLTAINAINKKTKKRVTLLQAKGYKGLIHNLSMIDYLNLPNIIKLYGIRYPLSAGEAQKLEKKELQIEGKIIDLTSFFAVIEPIKSNYSLSENAKYVETQGKAPEFITPTIRSEIVFCISNLMKKMHSKSYVYGNYFINSIYLNENLEPKLFYFDYTGKENKTMIAFFGSSVFLDPNLCINENIAMKTSDVYSFAILLYRMFDDCNYSYNHKINLRFFMSGKRLERPNMISDDYWELIQKCWNRDPDRRPSFDEIVEMLKDDRFAIKEFGIETDLDDLHEYQQKYS